VNFDLLQGQRVTVTGGAGFIGSHLVDALVSHGAEVTVLDNLSSGSRAVVEQFEPAAVRFIEGDLRDIDACREAVEGARYVFHQAARGSVPRSIEDPAGTFEVNLQGTIHLFEAARGAKVERVVYASSSSVYGDSTELPKREGSEGRPLSPYAATKRLSEEAAQVFSLCYQQSFIGLRYFNVYGPRQDPNGPYAAVIPRFFDALLRGEKPKIYGDGLQSRDFTYVTDVVMANLRSALAPAPAAGRAYNVGGGHATTVLELAAAVEQELGVEIGVELLPPRAGDVLHSLADLSQIESEIGYSPETRLADGLALSAPHYRSLNRV